MDRRRSIRGAVMALRQRYGELILSRVYETEAVGFEGNPFYNLVAGFDTELAIAELNRDLREIEDAFGRVRGADKFTPRTLDLDLLTYGDAVGRFDGSELPRDEILRYAFVLGPLAEAAGDEPHPSDGRTYREIWEAFGKGDQPIRPITLLLNEP